MTPALKRRLDAAAEKGGRSQSQEAEFRLERSFEREDLLPDGLTLAFGKRLAGILLAVGVAMHRAARFLQGPSWNPVQRDWINKPKEFNRAFRAAVALLEAARPPGPVPLDFGDDHLPTKRDPGEWLAAELISALRGDDPDHPLSEEAAEIREL